MLSHKQSKLFVYIYIYIRMHKRFHINKANYLYIYIRMHKRVHINKANYVYIDSYAQMLSHKQSKLFVYRYVCTNAFT